MGVVEGGTSAAILSINKQLAELRKVEGSSLLLVNASCQTLGEVLPVSRHPSGAIHQTHETNKHTA